MQSRAQLQEEADRARDRLSSAAEEAVKAIGAQTNDTVRACFEQQRELEQAARKVKAAADGMQVQAQQWDKNLTQLGEAVKQLGDFETWLEALEWDMHTIAVALEEIHEKESERARES